MGSILSVRDIRIPYANALFEVATEVLHNLQLAFTGFEKKMISLGELIIQRIEKQGKQANDAYCGYQTINRQF